MWADAFITSFYFIEPGRFEFSKPSYIVKDGISSAQLFVNRVNGADGSVSVKWQTKDMSAKNNTDYIGGEGTLSFSHGETQKNVEITILETDVSTCFYHFCLSYSYLFNFTMLSFTIFKRVILYEFVHVK